ncbi:MAG: Ig-like domain-containing protein [Sediminicola sp.]
MTKHNFTIAFFVILLLSCTEDSETQEIPDTTAPVVGFSLGGFPSVPAGEVVVVGSQIVVNVEAVDEGGIAKIEAFINNDKVGEDAQAPYSITINLASYTSKVGKSTDFVDYALKITATDKAGNMTSIEQTIHIDDKMPTITDVSLVSGSVLHGNVNSILFDVMDNQELSAVSIYLNDDLQATFNDANYIFNLDTSKLPDGENTFKIEAVDPAGNIGRHIVQFIVDNQGPEITLETLQEGQLIDAPIILSPVVVDAYSKISSVEIYFDGELVYSSDGSEEIDYNFEPENYPAGAAMFRIRTIDELGNANEMERNIAIVRLLLKLTIPEGYLSPHISTNHFVIASEMDGSLLDMKEIILETREIKLSTSEEFDIEKEFVITFASLGKNGVASYLYSIANVNRKSIEELNLSVPKRYTVQGTTGYTINGFSEQTQLSAFGRDYQLSSSEVGEPLITSFIPSNHASETGPIYVYGFNPLNNFYNYQFVKRPISPDYPMNFTDFEVQHLETKQLTTTPSDFLNNDRYLTLYGYRTQEDMDGQVYHQLWSYGYGQSITTSFTYQLNTQFYGYAHDLIIGNYRSKGVGLPSDVTIIPNWSVEYTFQNNSVSLTKSGTGHIVGEIYLEGGYDIGVPYQWNLFFDSNREGDIVLPNIPESLQDYPLYNLYQTNNIELGRVGLIKYDNIGTYGDYLEQIIKANKAFTKSSPRFESIFSGNTTQTFGNMDFFYNWW